MKSPSLKTSDSKKQSTALPKILESDIQIQVVEYLALMAAQCGFLFFAVPNEGLGQAKTGAGLGRMARLKKMGLRSGVADLVLVKAGQAYFLELKRPCGKWSANQQLFAGDCYLAGAGYAVAYSFDEALKILKEWGLTP